MNPPEDVHATAAERRRARRDVAQGTLRLALVTTELAGRIDNVSQSGILFFSDEPLRVTVEVEQDGVRRTRSGRLVRGQRMRGDSIGWAVEYDPD
jgi:hypothetical protein